MKAGCVALLLLHHADLSQLCRNLSTNRSINLFAVRMKINRDKFLLLFVKWLKWESQVITVYNIDDCNVMNGLLNGNAQVGTNSIVVLTTFFISILT